MLGFVAAGVAAFLVPSLPSSPTALRASQPCMAVAEADVAEEVEWKGAESWSKGFAEPEPVFDVLAVKSVLPHRYPFLLVDKVIEFIPGKKAVGVKKVTANEEL
jgi:hypothetical protein